MSMVKTQTRSLTEMEAAADQVSLSRAERDRLCQQLQEDGYATLPQKLNPQFNQELVDAVDRLAAAERERSGIQATKVQNCVDLDPALQALLLYRPALQLSYDMFGPMFYLNQSNFMHRPQSDSDEMDFMNATGWHHDGPRPQNFPTINGVMGLHYLKFGYFLNDLTGGNGGALQIVRASHLRPELDFRGSAFDINDYKEDVVTFNCEPGTVVAFNQALWHAAPANHAPEPRKNIYYSYCPCWMRAFDHATPTAEELAKMDSPIRRFLMGEARDPKDFWLPSAETKAIMSEYD